MHLGILKVIATSGFLTALECNEFVFGRGSVPDPAGGAYSTPPDLPGGLRGTLLLTEKRRDGRGQKGKKRKGRERKEEEGRREKGR